MAHELLYDPVICLKLKQEYEQIIKDRDDLRYVILKD